MKHRLWPVCLLGLWLWACEDKTKLSIERATADATYLAGVAAEDLKEVRSGLPQGGKLFEPLYAGESSPASDLAQVRDALEENRRQVQDLRVAKSTFFALAAPDGVILRNDQEQDRMAGKDLFAAFPDAKKALTSKAYTEARGAMPEAAGVAAPRKDAQWIAVQPVVADGGVKGLYVTGWSWTSYAYRLEFALRGKIRSDLLASEGQGANEPLVYVMVLVDKSVYGAPVTPDVNLQAVKDLELAAKLDTTDRYAGPLDITGREYGVAAKTVPEYGGGVAVVVLRSET